MTIATDKVIRDKRRRHGLRIVRLRADISQAELARQVSVTALTISGLENGRSNPSFRVLRRLMQVLAAEPGELFPDLYTRVGED